MAQVDYIEILNSSTSIDTLQKFKEEFLVAEDFSIQELFIYQGNNLRIAASYFIEDIEKYGFDGSPDFLRNPVLIRVPADKIDKSSIAAVSNNIFVNKDFNAFFGEQIDLIINDSNYEPLQKFSSGSVKKQFNSPRVWIWCRSIDKIIDLSPFIEVVTTNVAKTGGNFNLTLPPVTGEFNQATNSWQISKNDVKQFVNGNSLNFVAKSQFFKGNRKRNDFIFHLLIQSNDVVFIQFEKLAIEKKSDKSGEFFVIDKSELYGNYFDMIGLVDNNAIMYNPANVEVGVSVQGRDLSKLLIEDGCYFFPLDFAGTNIQGSFLNQSAETGNRPLQRLVDGSFKLLAAFTSRSISYSMNFVLNLLSSIEVCPESLFSSYPKEQLKKVYLFQDSDEKNVTQVNAMGIWQITDIMIDSEVDNRKIVDSSIATEQGSLLNYFQKICHEPFVEFSMDTYGSKFFFIVRKPPFNRQSFTSNKVIDIDEGDVLGDTLGFYESNIFTWYQIIPQGNFFGDDSKISLAFFPAIFFKEYAEIWGSRPYQVVSNYIDYNTYKQEGSQISVDNLRMQSLEDLKYMIECNAYNPFVRSGTLTMNGDRTIKRGMNVRLKSTGEIFYVDAVANSSATSTSTNDRTSILTLTRGMVEKYINSYFNVIDFSNSSEGRFSVNKEIFKFFLNRGQFQ